jgi:hypothetical protein
MMVTAMRMPRSTSMLEREWRKTLSKSTCESSAKTSWTKRKTPALRPSGKGDEAVDVLLSSIPVPESVFSHVSKSKSPPRCGT